MAEPYGVEMSLVPGSQRGETSESSALPDTRHTSASSRSISGMEHPGLDSLLKAGTQLGEQFGPGKREGNASPVDTSQDTSQVRSLIRPAQKVC